jgi:two-component system response regulator GlrR
VAITETVSVLLDASGVARAIRLPAFTLKQVGGPGGKKEKRFAQTRTLIGSGPAADFPVADPTVSAVHCEIVVDERGFRVRDLDAKNGVVLGGRRVQEAWLQRKDDLVLGETTVRFKLSGDADERPLDRRNGFGRLAGSSACMRQLYDQLARAAASDVSVLLQGETGTGKELAADAIISEGIRREKPLAVLDCARLPPTLAESELFGHEKDAFTGAVAARPGAFERANGGTVFLDEIGELPLPLQPKLLGVLERRAVQRIGGAAPIPLDVRFIAATHRELARAVNLGTFRADLYYRIAAVEIRLPALREHREDIPELVSRFVDEVPGGTKLSPAVLQRLYEADYPGNVRELRAMVERAALGFELEPAAPAPAKMDLALPYRLQKDRLLAGFEREYMSKLLESTRGNVSEAARVSGLSRVHLHEVIRRLGLRGDHG